MWVKYLVAAALFYVFAVLQNSFLAHFNVFGVTPNLVLIFYFLLLFFDSADKFLFGIFGAFVAGFLLDAFSHIFLGISIIIFLILMLIFKKILQLLWERNDEYSVVYFASLFVFYLALYKFLLNSSLFVLNSELSDFSLNWKILIIGAYNLFFALIGFYVFDRLNIFRKENKQLELL